MQCGNRSYLTLLTLPRGCKAIRWCERERAAQASFLLHRHSFAMVHLSRVLPGRDPDFDGPKNTPLLHVCCIARMHHHDAQLRCEEASKGECLGMGLRA